MRYLSMVTALLFTAAAGAQAPIHPTPLTAAEIPPNDVIPGRPRLVYNVDETPPVLTQCVNDGATTECTAVAAIPDVVTGDAIERAVYQRNRGQTMVFGDFQFRVPSSGNSSLQIRVGSGVLTLTNFLTHWSHQQGGASEESISFAVGTGWRYFRTQGLTLTQHNNYQEAHFQSNGWLYHVGVIVGGSWNNNRFFFTRWRLEGIKGDAGADGLNGIDGTDGVDGISIDHVSQTAGDSSPGTSNTYTLWSDAGETANVGTFDVPIPTPADAAKPLEDLVAEGNGSWSADETITLSNGKTWDDLVTDGYEKVFISAKENNWRGKTVGGYFLLADLIRDGGVETWTVASGSNRYEVTVSGVTGTGTTFSVLNGTGGHSDFKMWGVRAQKELVVINPTDATVDTTEVGTALSAGSTRHYVIQWDGTKMVNTLAREVWTTGTLGNSGYRRYVVDHLTQTMRVYGRQQITSSGTVSWTGLSFADADGFVFAHDLREAQAETAALRINSRTVNSVSYTLHDSAGTGDGGSVVNFEASGEL